MRLALLAAGCIYANESSLVTILDSNFTNNAGLSAGSVALWNSTVTVNNTVFVNNSCNSQGEHRSPCGLMQPHLNCPGLPGKELD